MLNKVGQITISNHNGDNPLITAEHKDRILKALEDLGLTVVVEDNNNTFTGNFRSCECILCIDDGVEKSN